MQASKWSPRSDEGGAEITEQVIHTLKCHQSTTVKMCTTIAETLGIRHGEGEDMVSVTGQGNKNIQPWG